MFAITTRHGPITSTPLYAIFLTDPVGNVNIRCLGADIQECADSLEQIVAMLQQAGELLRNQPPARSSAEFTVR